MLLTILEILAALVILGIVVLMCYARLQGKEKIVFDVKARTPARLTQASPEKICFEVEVPYKNMGTDQGVILDAYVRPYLCQEQYDGALLRGKVNLKNVPRDDDYFEAVLVNPGSGNTLVCKFELTPLHAADAYEALKGMPEIDVALFVDERGRDALYQAKKIITLTPEEFAAFKL